jgi:TPP-dependent pyruvate/acetoin dehydrogenase alpha subunit
MEKQTEVLERAFDGYDPEFLRGLYHRMLLIREFELRVNQLFLRGIMPGTIHLSHGQEATVVGMCAALKPEDVVTLTHRGHGQALAKGVPARSLMAELFGKATGCCRGKGGSLHVGDMRVGALPAIAVVAAAAPIACGMALAFKKQGSERVAVCFHGDGASNKGDWHEALNLASVWQLPVIFLCENNLYGVTTRIDAVSAVPEIAKRAVAYGMPGVAIYGNDPLTVYEAAQEAVARARAGHGPTLLECKTYRQGGHKRDDAGTYRPKDEVELWLSRDPVARFGARLLEAGLLTEESKAAIAQAVLHELNEAERFALESPLPPIQWALEDVYA